MRKWIKVRRIVKSVSQGNQEDEECWIKIESRSQWSWVKLGESDNQVKSI